MMAMSLRLSRLSLLTRFGVLSVAMLVLLAACARIRAQAPDRGARQERSRGDRRPGGTCGRPAQPHAGRPARHVAPRAAAELDQRLQTGVFADTGIQRVKIFDATAADLLLRQARRHRRHRRRLDRRRARARRRSRVALRPRGRPHGQGRAVRSRSTCRCASATTRAPVGVYEVYLSYTATEEAIAEDTRTMYMRDRRRPAARVGGALSDRVARLAPAAPPGHPRRADRPAEPRAARGPDRARARPRRAQRRGGRRPLHRPRPLQGDQRHARATPTATSCCARSRCDSARSFAMATRSRAWAATSSPCCCRA